MNRIFWAGDSTVQTNKILSYPQTGIGQVFPLYLRPGYSVENHARNGRSTKSFLDQGRLLPIEERIGEGDFLFIQFGHNDEKEQDPLRYTDPRTDFRENLRIFIGTAKRHGAQPVLITPLERRCFDENGKLGESGHRAYADAVRCVAEEDGIPLVDLYARSREALARMGDAASRSLYMNLAAGLYENYPEGKCDNSHLRCEGAVFFAGLIAEELKKCGGRCEEMLLTGEDPEVEQELARAYEK